MTDPTLEFADRKLFQLPPKKLRTQEDTGTGRWYIILNDAAETIVGVVIPPSSEDQQ